VVSYYVNITKIGSTSVTMDVLVWAQRQFAEEGDYIPVTEASVTMVAVDDKCKPISLSES